MTPDQRARALRLADEIEPTTHHPIIYLEKLRSAATLLRELAGEQERVPLTDDDIRRALELVDRLRHRAEIGAQPIFSGDCADIIAALLAERVALARDAARYVFIRDEMWHNHDHLLWREPRQHLDAAIDAAMGASDES